VSERIVLRALDGSNPLAFLAAVGTLRLLTMRAGRNVRMRWERRDAWHPVLTGVGGSTEELSELVRSAVSVPVERFGRLGKDITVAPEVFGAFAGECEDGLNRKERQAADFAVAFGSELCTQPRDERRIQYTDLCFMTGSGHQHFLGTMEVLKKSVTAGHVWDALFGEWRREKGNSMRWDPQDAAEYALQWGDPSLDGASAVWGANLLAVEGLPVFGAYAGRSGRSLRLETTGFRKRDGADWPEFSWPIWETWAGLDVVRSLVGLADLGEERPKRGELQEMGIGEVYRAARVRIGKGANFKVSFRPAVAV
jgi:hypothetical protein